MTVCSNEEEEISADDTGTNEYAGTNSTKPVQSVRVKGQRNRNLFAGMWWGAFEKSVCCCLAAGRVDPTAPVISVLREPIVLYAVARGLMGTATSGNKNERSRPSCHVRRIR